MEDVNYPAAWRWNELKVDDIWCDAVKNWKQSARGHFIDGEPASFSDQVANFLHREPGGCAKILDTKCTIGLCSHEGTGAGSQLLIQSFVNAHQESTRGPDSCIERQLIVFHRFCKHRTWLWGL